MRVLLTSCFYSRSSHRRCSIKKMFLKISQNLQENTCVGVSFFIKLQASALQSCRPVTQNRFITLLYCLCYWLWTCKGLLKHFHWKNSCNHKIRWVKFRSVKIVRHKESLLNGSNLEEIKWKYMKVVSFFTNSWLVKTDKKIKKISNITVVLRDAFGWC